VYTSDTSFNTMSVTYIHGSLKTVSKVKMNIFNIIKNNNIFWASVFTFQDCYSENKKYSKQHLNFQVLNFRAV
jgi:hypothetical protein